MNKTPAAACSGGLVQEAACSVVGGLLKKKTGPVQFLHDLEEPLGLRRRPLDHLRRHVVRRPRLLHDLDY